MMILHPLQPEEDQQTLSSSIRELQNRGLIGDWRREQAWLTGLGERVADQHYLSAEGMSARAFLQAGCGAGQDKRAE